MKLSLAAILGVLGAAVLLTGTGLWVALTPEPPWWAWVLFLFVFSTAIGSLAVLSGLGGGVLFVALVGGLAPFHLDFVRGAGLLVALSGSISAAPRLLRLNLASLRLAMPLALFSSTGAIFGAVIGLRAPLALLQLSLGGIILALSVFFLIQPQESAARSKEFRAGGVCGGYLEPGRAEPIFWQARRLAPACLLFSGIGFLAGLFGLGAGWANVPTLHFLMGAPLKICVATSSLLIGLADAPAALVYLQEGAILPVIALPSVLGMMLGARLGAGLLQFFPTSRVRWITVGILAVSGLKALHTGWGLF